MNEKCAENEFTVLPDGPFLNAQGSDTSELAGNHHRTTRPSVSCQTMTVPRPEDRKTWLCIDAATMAYEEAWNLQKGLAYARHTGSLESDVFIFLEHPPVFTLGQRGGMEHLRVCKSFLEREGIPILHVERGGSVTFHGPGQIVGYGIVDLASAGWKVVDYVTALEEVMIRTAAQWGLVCERRPGNRGVWVRGRKLGSLGIAVRQGVSFHGFAFNVNIALEPFDWIHPCGLQGVEMTSLERELGREMPLKGVRAVVRSSIESVFRVKLVQAELLDVLASLELSRISGPRPSAGTTRKHSPAGGSPDGKRDGRESSPQTAAS